MKITRVRGEYMKVVKGNLVRKILEPAYLEGDVSSKVKLAKALAEVNDLKSADGIAVGPRKVKEVSGGSLKELFESGENNG